MKYTAIVPLFLLIMNSIDVFAADPAKPASDVITEDLFEGLPAAKPEKKSAENSDASAEVLVPKSDRVENSEGEDLGFGSAQDPFAEVARKMKKSQELLVQRELTDASNALRGEIVTDLDKLLSKMQKQCSGGNCNKPGDGNKSGAGQKPGNSDKSGQASKPSQPTKKPASDSTDRLDKPGSNKTETIAEADIIREVWGHLPPKLREAMQNASLEEYLPKYEQHIRDYYRRLAEESRTGLK